MSNPVPPIPHSPQAVSPGTALRSFRVITPMGVIVALGKTFDDACETLARAFKAECRESPEIVQSPSSKVGHLLGKCNANTIKGYTPGQLKCVGATAEGKPLLRAKLPNWNAFKTVPTFGPDGFANGTKRVMVEDHVLVEMPVGEILDVGGS